MKVFILIFLVLAGCGESPLFNHVSEANSAVAESLESNFGFANVNMGLRIDWTPGCPGFNECQFKLKSWSWDRGTQEGPYEDLPYTLEAKLWMPSMGHGSSPVTITRLSSGVYEISRVNFIMPGTWQVFLSLKEGARLVDEAVLTYRL